MLQVITCECGEATMLDGRCIGCKRVRPASFEITQDIKRITKELCEKVNDLHRAQSLEK
jgi:hypothetical protein